VWMGLWTRFGSGHCWSNKQCFDDVWLSFEVTLGRLQCLFLEEPGG
jgi:hypothetical protein